ncbi:hypothetical protein [Cellulosimicrobium funkei]|uniref:hypothetical protein n=1 Tax=Cellulosimicrobium funkei TaxID=264251 RepID=UPI0034133FEC
MPSQERDPAADPAGSAASTEGVDAPKAPKVALEMPHGNRSCGTGGTWAKCHANPDWEAGLAAVKVMARSDDDFRMLSREIDRFLKAAERGDLTYGKSEDVYRMTTAPLILELRFERRVEYPDGRRAVRLYFSEPDVDPGVLLAVKLGAKPATAGGLDLQNDHAAEAQDHVLNHYERQQH